VRLSETQVQTIVLKIIETLKQRQLIVFKQKEGAVVSAMSQVFLANLRAEDAIIEEAKKILDKQLKQSKLQVDEAKMLQMIKRELAKKQNIII
jgi:hypothetical protein